MKTYRTIILLLFLIVFATNGHAQKDKAPYFFIQLSDPQFGFIDPKNGFAKETELYEKAVAAINRLKPDFVVITGDLVNNTTDPSQIAEFKRITSKIDSKISVYLTPGNHDVGNTPDSAAMRTYVKNYGYDRFSFTHKGSLFVGFNSSVIKAKKETFEKDQYHWLENTLRKGKKANHVILFCHYPFFINAPDEPDTYYNIDTLSRKKYLSLFESTKVEYIFSGHLHHNNTAQSGNMHFVTTSAIGRPLGKDPSGLRIIKVYPDRIEHQYYGIDELIISQISL